VLTVKPQRFVVLFAVLAAMLAVGCGDEETPIAPSSSGAGTSPEISAVLPPGASSGLSVTVAGSGFGSSAGTVEIGGKPAAIDSWSDTEIRCTVPDGIPESLNSTVAVTTASGKGAVSQINVTPPHTYQVTVGHATDHYPCWSSGGTYIYYSTTQSGGANWDIYRIPATGGTPERVTFDDSPDFNPDVQLSSGELAWCSTQRLINNTDGDYEIFYGYPRCAAPGAACTIAMLTDNGSRDLDPAYATTIHAGYSMAYTHEEVDDDGHFLAWMVMLHTNGPDVALTEGRQPNFSPNGRWVVYSHDDNIYKIETTGGTSVQLTNTGTDQYPHWGVNDQIVFQRTNGGNFEDIFVMNADGSDPRVLVGTRNNEYCPTWSPDGKSVVYYALVVGNFDIYVYVIP
jgi:Tol biopolymer transport system component